MEKITCNNCQTQNNNNSKYCSNCGYELPKSEVKQEEIVQVNENNKKPNKANLIGIIIGMIVFALSYWGVQKLFHSAPTFDKKLMALSSELNKTCPIMVDAQTQLDNTVALPNTTFQYNYTLLETEASSIDTTNFKTFMEPNILEQVKTNPQMKDLREIKVTLNYLYRDKNKRYIALITITPNMYE